MSPTDEPVEPTEQQLRILERVQARLAERWTSSPVKRDVHHRHWEDEELGILPIGASAAFTVSLASFTVWIGTPFPWEADATAAIEVRFPTYGSGRNEPAWALLEDGPTRRALADLGFRGSLRRASWLVAGSSESGIIDAIVQTITRLAELPVRILRPDDLPPNTPWPWPGLIEMLAADRVIEAADLPSGKSRIVTETDGERHETTVDTSALDLISWLRGRYGLDMPPRTRTG